MSETSGDRTHEATPERRRQAREQGQVARSQDLGSALVLFGAIGTLMVFGGGVAAHLAAVARSYLGGEAWLKIDGQTVVHQWYSLLLGLAGSLLPILALIMVLGILANLVQIGFLFLPAQVAPDLSRINPGRGFGRLFSLHNLVRLGFGGMKVAVVAVVAYYSLYADRDAILGTVSLDTPQIARFMGNTILLTSLKVAGALVALALFDYGFQWWKREQDLKMTTQEVRDEAKNLQGDPQVLARRRGLRRQLVENRVADDVRQADVIVTDSGELAVALRYDPREMKAPQVVAKGTGPLAARIRRLAGEHGIPIVEKKRLAQKLFRQADANQDIASAQFAETAEVLAYAYELSGKPISGAA